MTTFKTSMQDVMGHCAQVPLLRQIVIGLQSIRLRNHPYMRRHPFDLQYGIDTSGLVPAWMLRTGSMSTPMPMPTPAVSRAAYGRPCRCRHGRRD